MRKINFIINTICSGLAGASFRAFIKNDIKMFMLVVSISLILFVLKNYINDDTN